MFIETNNGRPPAVIHADLDGASAIYAVHGWPYPFERDPLFESGLTNLLALLDELELRATLFVIAGDLDDPRKRALLKTAVDRGHEIAAHSLTHRKLTTLDRETRRREIFASRQRLQDELGVPVYGFRAPYFDIDGETLAMVAEAGYRYDSSCFPGARLNVDGRRLHTPHTLHRLFDSLVGLPLPAHTPLPFPFHPSYSLVLGSWYFRLGLRRFRRGGAPLVFLFHLTDLADPLPPVYLTGRRSTFFTLSHMSGAGKRERCLEMVRMAQKAYRFVGTLALLDGFQPARRASTPIPQI